MTCAIPISMRFFHRTFPVPEIRTFSNTFEIVSLLNVTKEISQTILFALFWPERYIWSG